MSDLLVFFDATLFNMTGLLFIVLGVLTLIRMSGFPDLTVDGSFTIGAAVYATLMSEHSGTILALSGTLFAGATGGALTWALNQKLGIGKVVSGILSMIILILSAPYLTGGTSQSLLNIDGIQKDLNHFDSILTSQIIPHSSYQLHLSFMSAWFLVTGVVFYLIFLFLRSKKGIQLRYLGTALNATLLSKKRKEYLLLFGLISGNALVALGGAIEAERRGGYTNNMGMGILLVALTALVLGEGLFKAWLKREHLYLSEYLYSSVLGVFIYSIGIQCILQMQLDFVDVRLLSAFLLILLLGVSGKFYSNRSRLF